MVSSQMRRRGEVLCQENSKKHYSFKTKYFDGEKGDGGGNSSRLFRKKINWRRRRKPEASSIDWVLDERKEGLGKSPSACSGWNKERCCREIRRMSFFARRFAGGEGQERKSFDTECLTEGPYGPRKGIISLLRVHP